MSPSWNPFRSGRCFIGHLNGGEDLGTAVAAFCREQSIETATFQAAGVLSRVTVGVFDPFQRVYVTFSDEAPYEIAACCGTVTRQDGAMAARAQIVVCDRKGKTTGGRLFSQTIVMAAEIYLQELLGAPLERYYEAETGQDDLRIARPLPKDGPRQAAASPENAQSSLTPFQEDSMEVSIIKAENLKPKPDESQLGFGKIYTDHMFNMDYHPDRGWHDPRIEPYGPLVLDPATMYLHYAQGVFEGLKAFRTASGAVQLFRPRDNIRRMNRSSKRLCIPEIEEGFFLDALKQFIRMEREWVPSEPGTSLYIRPTIIATDPYLGVRASHTYRFFIILSPVGAYYAAGFNPVKIWVTKEHVRAVRGGVGEAKTPGNYAASLYAGDLATRSGYAQVLWLDGVSQQYVEEVGSMNIFFVIGDEIVTPELTGSILPGITRDSVIALTRSWGMKMTERKISIDEVMDAHKQGSLKEIFGSGTAAVISPVGELKYGDEIITIGGGEVGPLAGRLFQEIQDIQYGRVQDPMNWIEAVD